MFEFGSQLRDKNINRNAKVIERLVTFKYEHLFKKTSKIDWSINFMTHTRRTSQDYSIVQYVTVGLIRVWKMQGGQGWSKLIWDPWKMIKWGPYTKKIVKKGDFFVFVFSKWCLLFINLSIDCFRNRISPIRKKNK